MSHIFSNVMGCHRYHLRIIWNFQQPCQDPIKKETNRICIQMERFSLHQEIPSHFIHSETNHTFFTFLLGKDFSEIFKKKKRMRLHYLTFCTFRKCTLSLMLLPNWSNCTVKYLKNVEDTRHTQKETLFKLRQSKGQIQEARLIKKESNLIEDDDSNDYRGHSDETKRWTDWDFNWMSLSTSVYDINNGRRM